MSEQRTFTPDEPAATGVPEPKATAADVWRVYDALTRPKTVRLARMDAVWLVDLEKQREGHCDVARYRAATTERVTLPSLFDQLASAVQSGAGSQAHGVQESKPPLDISAMALLISIAETVRSGCWNWHLKRTYDTPRDLKAVIRAVIDHADDKNIDLIHRQIRSWVGQIKATISSEADRTWRMHGAACRVCASTSVIAFDEDGQQTRIPALIVHSDDGVIDKVECGFCGSTLSGATLVQLVRDTLNVAARQTA